jgi:hypothetical protein
MFDKTVAAKPAEAAMTRVHILMYHRVGQFPGGSRRMARCIATCRASRPR